MVAVLSVLVVVVSSLPLGFGGYDDHGIGGGGGIASIATLGLLAKKKKLLALKSPIIGLKMLKAIKLLKIALAAKMRKYAPSCVTVRC